MPDLDLTAGSTLASSTRDLVSVSQKAAASAQVSPIEAMRQQMRQQVASGAARAVAPLLHRMTPIKVSTTLSASAA